MSRPYRNVTTLPVRTRPFWKLTPADRTAHGLCPFCGQPDAVGDHLVFGCKLEGTS